MAVSRSSTNAAAASRALSSRSLSLISGSTSARGLCFRFALVLDLQDMPSKGGAYQVAQLPHRQRESDFLKRCNHLPTREIAEVAPLSRRRRILRVLLGQGRKILTIPQRG